MFDFDFIAPEQVDASVVLWLLLFFVDVVSSAVRHFGNYNSTYPSIDLSMALRFVEFLALPPEHARHKPNELNNNKIDLISVARQASRHRRDQLCCCCLKTAIDGQREREVCWICWCCLAPRSPLVSGFREVQMWRLRLIEYVARTQLLVALTPSFPHIHCESWALREHLNSQLFRMQATTRSQQRSKWNSRAK